jgi:membrane dipeptidase
MLDLHVDSLLQHQLFGYDLGRRHRAGLPGQPLFWHADVPRMIEGDYTGACLGIHYWPWESERGWRAAMRQIDVLDRLVAGRNDLARVGGIEEHSTWDADELALAPGVEGAHVLNGRLERVDVLAERGVAYLTLTHFSANRAATPSLGRGSDARSGLTGFGRDLVEALEREGIVVDLAHVNRPGVLEACRVASRPVLCTHTGVCGVHEHRRNITDGELEAIASTGGVVGIIAAPLFLTGRLVADSTAVADHVEYVAEQVGLRHVALGSDYDGWIPTIPSDHRDCRDLSRVVEVLRERGWDDEALERVGWRNALEVLSGRR